MHCLSTGEGLYDPTNYGFTVGRGLSDFFLDFPDTKVSHTQASGSAVHRDKLEARCRNVGLGHVQTKEMQDAQRRAQKAIAAIPVRSEVKLVTGAQLSEAGSYTSAVLRRSPVPIPPKT